MKWAFGQYPEPISRKAPRAGGRDKRAQLLPAMLIVEAFLATRCPKAEIEFSFSEKVQRLRIQRFVEFSSGQRPRWKNELPKDGAS